MSTATLTHSVPLKSRLAPALERLLVGWHAHMRRIEDRRALEHARRLGPRLRADMGIETEARSLVGGWDDLRPNGWLVSRRR